MQLRSFDLEHLHLLRMVNEILMRGNLFLSLLRGPAACLLLYLSVCLFVSVYYSVCVCVYLKYGFQCVCVFLLCLSDFLKTAAPFVHFNFLLL